MERSPSNAFATWLARALCVAVPQIAPFEFAIRAALVALWPRVRRRIESTWAVRLGITVDAGTVEVEDLRTKP
jgi:hypothetical protein